MAEKVPFSFVPPLPRPDPRGSTWIERALPKLEPGALDPFQPGEIPTAALLASRNIDFNPDRLAYHPDEIMTRHFLRALMQQDI